MSTKLKTAACRVMAAMSTRIEFLGLDYFIKADMRALRLAQKTIIFVLVASLLAACGSSSSDNASPEPSPEPQPPAPPVPDPRVDGVFVDVTAASGVLFQSGFFDGNNIFLDTQFGRNFEVSLIIQGGAAAGDYDGDGDIDIFITRGDAANLLYRNEGGMRFEEVAEAAGVAFSDSSSQNLNFRHGSPAFVDLDGDDNLDLFLPGLDDDPTVVFLNNGEGSFTQVSAGAGLDNMDSETNFSPAFGDYDLDGDLDLMLAHWGTLRNFDAPGETEHLWRNDSADSGIDFTAVSSLAGISDSFIMTQDPLIILENFDYSFAPTFARINDDIYPDILLVADFNYSQVYINNQDGTFTNTTDFDVIIDGNGMGSAVGDYDADGDLDWFVSSILAVDDDADGMTGTLSQIGNRLYRNDFGQFTDVTEEAGVADGGWGWGSCFVDLDNDGNLDIYHTNGWPFLENLGGFPTDESRVFMSNGDGTFFEDAADLGLNDNEQGRGVVCADFDNDGDIDILQLHLNSPAAASLYENRLDSVAGYIEIDLVGLAPNTKGIGARITLVADGKSQTRDVLLANNFSSHNPTRQHFGLGDVETIDWIQVDWPAVDGAEVQTVIMEPESNQLIEIVHPGR